MKRYLLALLILLFIIPSHSHGQIHIEDSPIVSMDASLYAIAVIKNHTLIYEYYFNQHSAAELFNDQLLTKGIISILIGIAIYKGFISSLDEKIIRFVPDLKHDTNQRKKNNHYRPDYESGFRPLSLHLALYALRFARKKWVFLRGINLANAWLLK